MTQHFKNIFNNHSKSVTRILYFIWQPYTIWNFYHKDWYQNDNLQLQKKNITYLFTWNVI